MPALSDWQKNNGWLREDIATLQQASEAIQEATQNTVTLSEQLLNKQAQLQQTTEGLDQNITAQLAQQAELVVDSTTDVQAAIATAQGVIVAEINKANTEDKDGIVAQPKSAEDYYKNARLYELGGDYGNARRAYLQYFRLDNPAAQLGETEDGVFTALDPHIRFQRFLKIQDGVAGAREIYQSLFEQSLDPVDGYALILLSPTSKKRTALLNYAEQYPSFAPVLYELAIEYSDLRTAEPTLAEQREEKRYYDAFLTAAEAGQLTRYFIDNEMLDGWLQAAKKRVVELSKPSAGAQRSAIEIQVYHRETGWRFELELAEPALDIWYRMANEKTFTNTGPTGEKNVITDKPEPRRIIDFPDNLVKQDFELKYRDRNGQIQGPYSYTFDPQEQAIAAQINVLAHYTGEWLDFNAHKAYEVYYDFVDQYRCGIKTAWIGFGRPDPVDKLALNPCDPERHFESSSEDFLLFLFDQPFDIVSMRLEFIDGSNTDVIIFDTGFTAEDAEYFD